MQSSKQVSCMIKFACRKLTLIVSWKNYLRGWQKDQCCNNEVWWTVKYSVKYEYIFLPQRLEKLFFLSLYFNKVSVMTQVSPASTDFSSIQGKISFLPSLSSSLISPFLPPSLPSFLYFSFSSTYLPYKYCSVFHFSDTILSSHFYCFVFRLLVFVAF